MKKRLLQLSFLLLPIGALRAAQETRDVVMTVKGIEIPILIITPSSGKGPFPVVYNVHGGGWNGGTKTVVPPASVPPEAKFLSDELGNFTNNKESLFPDETACALYGLSSPEQKLKSSAFHHIRKNPPATLLFHGGKDILTHSSQSIRFAEKLREQGGQAEAIIFPEVNHSYFNPRCPVEYKTTMLKIAELYAKNFKLNPSKLDALPAKLDKMLSPFFPVDEIKLQAVLGVWKGMTETLAFNGEGEGTLTKNKDNSRPFTYIVSGNTILMDLGETKETYFMQWDFREIYKVHPDGRFAGDKEYYQKQPQ